MKAAMDCDDPGTSMLPYWAELRATFERVNRERAQRGSKPLHLRVVKSASPCREECYCLLEMPGERMIQEY